MVFGQDPFEDSISTRTKERSERKSTVLVMAPPKQWSNENLNFLVYYLSRALKKRFDFSIVSSEELGDKKSIENAVSTASIVLIIFDRPTETIAYAYKIAQDFDKPIFVVKGYSEGVEAPKGFEVPFGLLSGAILHKELGSEERTFIKLIREMILERDKVVMEMFVQGGELKLEFFTELLKHLDSATRRGLLKEMADKYPSDRSFWLASGRMKLIDGDTEDALHDFDEATRLSPDDPWIFAQKGSALVDVGDFDKAIKEITTSIKLKPVNPQAYFLRGNTQYMLDNIEEALDSFEESYRQKPDFVAAVNNLAHVYAMHHRYDEALRLLTRAQDMDEDYPFTYLNRAGCLRSMGRPNEQVLEVLQKAEKAALTNLIRGDDFERSTYCLFYVYAAIGNVDKAAEYMEKCIDYHIPIKRWRTLERVWDENIQNDPELKSIVERSKF